MHVTLLAFALVAAQEAPPLTQGPVEPHGDVLAPAATLVPGADPQSWVTPGARVPGLELPRVDGKGSVDLADLRGRKLLLIQFAAW